VTLFEHVRHPWHEERVRHGPVTVAGQHDTGSPYARFNTRLALAVTKFVGSMNCAWLFAAVALVSLPAALATGSVIVIVSWVAQTFFQLVLLSVIMVGQNVQSASADQRSEQTYNDTELLLHGQEQAAAHMAAQDVVLRALATNAGIEVDAL
jgi:hypothetical protein